MDMSEGNTLLAIPQRVAELGRIRLGEKGDKGQPVKLKTFRLTSGSKPTLEAAAALYGGKVQAWQGAPDEGMWQLTTAVAELDILIPRAIRNISQAFEMWKGGTNERRCDMTTAQTPAGAVPCICAAKGLDGPDRECEVVTRISVILPRVPGMGVWRLDTGGWYAATTLPATVQLLTSMYQGAFVPAVLRAEQKSKRERLPGGKVQTNRWVQPALDAPGATIGQLVEGTLREQPALPAGELPTPPQTARDRAAAARAAVEAREAAETTRPADSTAGGARDGTPAGEAAERSVEPEVVPPAASGSTALCASLPPSDGLGLTKPCARPPHGPKAPHVSDEGSWYDQPVKP